MSLKKLIKNAPLSFWIILIVHFLDSFAYFSFSYVLILYLRDDLHFDDTLAGVYYGTFGVCISVFTLILGFLVDILRVKKTLLISNGLGFIARILFIMTYNKIFTSIILFVFMAGTMAISGPAIPTAIRNYTNKKTQALGFQILYVVMNVGAILAPPCIDLLRIYYPNEGIENLTRYGFLIAATSLIHLVDFTLILLFVKDIEVVEKLVDSDDSDEVSIIKEDENFNSSGKWETRYITENNSPKMNWIKIKQLFKNKNLWRFVLLTVCTIGVKSTYRYIDALYPTYMERVPFNNDQTNSDLDVPYMSLLIINPILVIIGTIPTGLVLQRFHPYIVILVGTLISAISPFFMALQSYLGVILFLLILTIGEIIWSPQINNYVCYLAPKGQEGIFFSMATIPIFFSKMVSGVLSGYLLKQFCPEKQNCSNAQWIWVILGATTMLSPILLLVFTKIIKVQPGPNNKSNFKIKDDNELESYEFDDILINTENEEINLKIISKSELENTIDTEDESVIETDLLIETK